MILLLLGCGEPGPVDALLACGDADCHARHVEAAYAGDPERVIDWLSGLPDPVVQVALLDQLTHTYPADARDLCERVPRDDETRTRCARRNVRPHLFENPGGQKQPQKRNPNAAPGPRGSDLPLPPSAAAQWADVHPPTLDCGARPLAVCTVDEALVAAGSGADAATIGARCREGFVGDERGYGECLFKAAEVVAGRGAAGVPDALALCSDSVFGPMCIAHLLTLASPPVPAADAFTPQDITDAAAVATAFSAAPDGLLYADRFWASWVHSSIAAAAEVHGALLDHLPAEARHHVPVAAAHRLMSQRPPRSFEAEVQRLDEALARRADLAPPRYRPAATWMKVQLWERDWPGEEAFPTTWMLGPARRIRAPESGIDHQIAVLEAAGQLVQPPDARFFLAVLDDPTADRRVRFTAARIGAALDAAAAAQRTDDDPVIRARLSGSRSSSSRKPPPGAPVAQPPQPGSGG